MHVALLLPLLALQLRQLGGLRVIMTGLPDSRRSELQLRGRAGRWAGGRVGPPSGRVRV